MRMIAVLLSLCFSLLAETTGYIGLSIEDSTEFFTLEGKEDVDASTPQYKIKAGYGDIANFAVEASFSYMDYATDVFSENDGAALMFDITLYKGWDIGHAFYPYLDIGIGMGNMPVERELEDALTFSSFNFGGGVRYMITDSVDLDLGLNYKLRTWQAVSLVSDEAKVTSHVINPYIGVNYHF